MQESHFRKNILLIILGIAGAILFAILYDKVSPKASLDLNYTRVEIMEKSRSFLEGLGYDVRDYQQDAWLVFDGNTHTYLQTIRKVEEVNEMIRADTIATHAWQISWYHRNVSRSQELETFNAYVSPGGKIL